MERPKAYELEKIFSYENRKNLVPRGYTFKQIWIVKNRRGSKGTITSLFKDVETAAEAIAYDGIVQVEIVSAPSWSKWIFRERWMPRNEIFKWEEKERILRSTFKKGLIRKIIDYIPFRWDAKW